MSLKTCLLALLAFVSLTVHAQDKIFRKGGDVIQSKVLSVGKTTVIYKRFDNQDGPEYTILIKEVSKIVYQNGATDKFERGRFERGGRKETSSSMGKGGKNTGKNVKKYGDNILTVIPGAYTASFDGSMNDVGIGICYERLLDERGHIGFVLPLLLSFASNKDFNANFYSGGYPSYNGPNNYTSICFMPGVKFYPAKSNETVRYSIGASFFALFGSEPYQVYEGYNSSGTNTTGDWHYALYGLMINNSINVSVSKHFYMEVDLNAGFPVSDNRRRDYSSIDNLAGPYIQFALKLGGRF